MNFIIIDAHKKRSRCAVVNQEGQIIHKRSIPSAPKSFWEEFSCFEPGHTEVAVGATINWYWGVDTFQDLGLDVLLANPHKVRLIAESTIKTDTVDATALANLLLSKRTSPPRCHHLTRRPAAPKCLLKAQNFSFSAYIGSFLGVYIDRG